MTNTPQEDENDSKQTREAIRVLKELRDHPGWDIVKRIITLQINARIEQFILMPRKDMADEWEKEYQKGEVAGMKFVLALPDTELDTLEAEKEFHDGNDTDDASPASDDHPGASAEPRLHEFANRFRTRG